MGKTRGVHKIDNGEMRASLGIRHLNTVLLLTAVNSPNPYHIIFLCGVFISVEYCEKLYLTYLSN